MGLQGHSGHFYSKGSIMVVSSQSGEMSQPPIPLNVSLLSAYHLGVLALTDGFTDCSKYAKIKEHYSHIHFQPLGFFPLHNFFIFMTPLQGQQKKALARGLTPCDPVKYNELQTLLSDSRTLLFGYSV